MTKFKLVSAVTNVKKMIFIVIFVISSGIRVGRIVYQLGKLLGEINYNEKKYNLTRKYTVGTCRCIGWVVGTII